MIPEIFRTRSCSLRGRCFRRFQPMPKGRRETLQTTAKGNAMSHETYELKAEARERVGKGSAREVRRNGKVPAVIYGEKKPPQAIALSYKDVYYKIHGGGFMTTIATIDIGGEKVQVLPKDYQLDPGARLPDACGLSAHRQEHERDGGYSRALHQRRAFAGYQARRRSQRRASRGRVPLPRQRDSGIYHARSGQAPISAIRSTSLR